MKKIYPIFVMVILTCFYACGGECVKCNKTGTTTLRYCESDFPSSIQYHAQINALDSLGYDCFEK